MYAASKSAPSFIIELTDQRGAIGDRVNFHCKFAGTPIPGKIRNETHKAADNS